MESDTTWPVRSISMQELIAVIFGFWAIIPVLFTYATSRISVTHQNVYLSLIIMKYTKKKWNPTAGHKTQSEIKTTHDMFAQLMITQSSKYALVRRTFLQISVSSTNFMYQSLIMSILTLKGVWVNGDAVSHRRSGSSGDDEDLLLLQGIELNLSFIQSVV